MGVGSKFTFKFMLGKSESLKMMESRRMEIETINERTVFDSDLMEIIPIDSYEAYFQDDSNEFIR